MIWKGTFAKLWDVLREPAKPATEAERLTTALPPAHSSRPPSSLSMQEYLSSDAEEDSDAAELTGDKAHTAELRDLSRRSPHLNGEALRGLDIEHSVVHNSEG